MTTLHSFPTLFCLENLSGQRVALNEPWSPSLNGARAVPPGLDKEGYRKWCSEPSTHSLFFSGYEGANAALRVSEQNPPQFMHALVADYDAKVAPGEMDAFLKRASPDYPPNMVGSTFSGNARALWLFEAPFPVFDRKAQKAMPHGSRRN